LAGISRPRRPPVLPLLGLTSNGPFNERALRPIGGGVGRLCQLVFYLGGSGKAPCLVKPRPDVEVGNDLVVGRNGAPALALAVGPAVQCRGRPL
jgi:hypothetical protein